MKANDEPIPGPEAVGPDYLFEPDPLRPVNTQLQVARFFLDLVRKPAHWIRENVVEANRGPKYYWYHRKFERAVPIDECYMDDYACIHEANLEFKRNFFVDRSTLDILRYRKDSCYMWNMANRDYGERSEKCKDIQEQYDREEVNFFIKYGDLHAKLSVIEAFTKQKHRMIMERRKALRNQKEENS